MAENEKASPALLPTLATIPNFHKTAVAPYNPRPTSAYFGYFANCYGEQWVFTYDYDTGKALLAGGDVDWNEYPVRCVGESAAVDLVLNNDEYAWLQACWYSARHLRPRDGKKP